MLEYKQIEWKGTLRKTFEFYFHPEKIDKTSKEMYDLIGQDRVPDLFQFSTGLAQSVVKKSKPSNLIELAAINSIMRLMSTEGEQPIDTFVRFKNDINLWYKEMEDFGLNQQQQSVFKYHLLHLNGVADTQESIMLMAGDKRIAGFDLFQMTKLRKAVSKKKKEEALKIKKVLFEQCEKLGNNIIMAKYCWHQIERMLSYAFSIPHTLAYTLIGLIEANIFTKYNPIYWQTACLTVNSGSQELDEDDKKKDKNYGKVAEAIGKMKNYGVDIALPDINHAGISFTPDADNNRIVYSLKGIAGMNDETAKVVIENRPYTSFMDFHERVYQTKLIQRKHMINLIKAGSFNSFDTPIEIMKLFIFHEVDKKETLNMQNFKSILRLNLLNSPEYVGFLDVYYLREEIKKRKLTGQAAQDITAQYDLSTKDIIYKITPDAYEYYQKYFPDSNSMIEYGMHGILISDKQFDKEYKKFMEPLKEIIATPEFVREFNIAQFYELWDKHAQGTVEKWEMDAVTYYSDKHELDGVDFEKYNISNYFEIDPTPQVIEKYTRGGREYSKFKIYTLVGTVLDRNKDKHTFSLLTPDGVVICKTYAGAFSHYDKALTKIGAGGKKETIEKSWFTRGNLVMVKGFRREDQFILRTNAQKGLGKEHTINLILGVQDDGSLLLQSERENI